MGAFTRQQVNRRWFTPKPIDHNGKKWGKLRHRPKEGEDTFYDEIVGRLVGINFKEGEYNGKPANQFEFLFQDENGIDIVQGNEYGLFSQDLICRIANVRDFSKDLVVSAFCSELEGSDPAVWFLHGMVKEIKHGEPVKVEPLFKTKLTATDAEGTLVLPDVEYVEVNGVKHANKAKRMVVLRQLVDDINNRISTPDGSAYVSDLEQLPPAQHNITEDFDDVPF